MYYFLAGFNLICAYVILSGVSRPGMVALGVVCAIIGCGTLFLAIKEQLDE